MASDELSLFSYEILGLVGRGGAGPARPEAHGAPGADPRLGGREPVLRRAQAARPPRLPGGATRAREDARADRLLPHRQGVRGAPRVRGDARPGDALQERRAPAAADRGPGGRGAHARRHRRAARGRGRPARAAGGVPARHGGAAPPRDVPAASSTTSWPACSTCTTSSSSGSRTSSPARRAGGRQARHVGALQVGDQGVGAQLAPGRLGASGRGVSMRAPWRCTRSRMKARTSPRRPSATVRSMPPSSASAASASWAA